MKYATLDTNCLLHFQSPENIDWRPILNGPEIELIIFPVVVRELDRQKNEAPQGTRRRAQAAISKLRELRNSAKSEIREGVRLRFEPKEPSIDFEANQLDRNNPDDRLIAWAIQLASEKGDLDLTIVTNDLGLELKAESRFRVIRPPEKYRLPEEPDPLEQQNRMLRSELDSLKNRLPNLDLEFTAGGHRLDVTLPAALLTSDADAGLKRRLAEAKSQYPKAASGRSEWGLPGYTEGMIRSVNEKIERFYDAFEKYLQSERQYDMLEALKIRVQLVLKNDGKSPATDIDVDVRFVAEKILVVEESKYPQRPEPPQPPSTGMGLTFKMPEIIPLAEQLARLKEPDISSKVRPCEGGFSFSVHVKRLKHGYRQELPAFFILPPDRNLGAIGLQCRISCSELSRQIDRDLGIVVKQMRSEP